MLLPGVRIGVVLTGSHCTVDQVLPEIRRLKEQGAELTPIFSYTVSHTDNRFYRTSDLYQKITEITGNRVIESIVDAEPIGPQGLLDLVLVAPCTGNTMAKLANGITDTPALMAVKSQLRNQRPVVLAISTNDALGINARNLGYLLNAKNIYFVPFRQDDPHKKSNSLVAKMQLILPTVIEALKGRQIQPVLLGPND